MQYGDRTIIERNWDAMQRFMDFIAKASVHHQAQISCDVEPSLLTVIPVFGLAFAEWFRAGYGAALVTQVILTLIGLTVSGAVIAWVVYAAASGRNIKQRLTDPAPIDEPAAEPVTV